MYGTHFPTAGRQCPILCQRSHLPPSAFPKLEGESGAWPGRHCQGLSLITIRAHLINIPRGCRLRLAGPLASCRGGALCAGLGLVGAHTGSSDCVLGLAWACSQLSEALSVPSTSCPVQTFAFPVYPDPQCKTTSPRPRAALALSPRPSWEDASGPFSELVGIEKGAGPSYLSSMNWPGGDRTRRFQGTVLTYCMVPGREEPGCSCLREAQRTG